VSAVHWPPKTVNDVACPYCLAPPRIECRTMTGNKRERPHVVRRKAYLRAQVKP
jgi:hypothetical protein